MEAKSNKLFTKKYIYIFVVKYYDIKSNKTVL